MRYCGKCKVYIGGTGSRCPLCQNKLSGETATEDVYPKIPDRGGVYNLAVKILLLLSVIAIVITVAVNYFFQSKGWWSLIVVGVLATVWFVAGTAIRKRKNILKNILWQVVIISAACVLWDKCTGWRGWSVDFVLPILYAVSMIAMFIMNKILRLRAEDYIVYGWMGSLFGLIPLFWLLTGSVRHRIPSVICIGESIIFIAILVIFQGSHVVSEIKKRSHW